MTDGTVTKNLNTRIFFLLLFKLYFPFFPSFFFKMLSLFRQERKPFLCSLCSNRKDTQKMMDKAVKENRMISTFEGRIRMGIGSVILVAGIYNFIQHKNYGSLSVRLFLVFSLRSRTRNETCTTGNEFRRIGSIQYRIQITMRMYCEIKVESGRQGT